MSDKTGGPAYPVEEQFLTTGDISPPSTGMTLLDYFASTVDVSVYKPLETFKEQHRKTPQVEELAEFIACIRLTEAKVMLELMKEYMK